MSGPSSKKKTQRLQCQADEAREAAMRVSKKVNTAPAFGFAVEFKASLYIANKDDNHVYDDTDPIFSRN